MAQCNVFWNRYDGYYRDSSWRGRKELEGGALYTQVSHFLDLMIWWFGDMVNARTSLDTKKHSIQNRRLRYLSSAVRVRGHGTIAWTTCVYNKNYEGSITIIGDKGTVKIGGQYLNRIEYWDVHACPLPDDLRFVDKPNAYGKYQVQAQTTTG